MNQVATPPALPSRGRSVLVLGVVLHLAVAVFPLSASGLMAPGGAIVLLYAGWAGLGLAAWRTRRTRPWAMLLAAAAAVLMWFAVMTLGDLLLGWTA